MNESEFNQRIDDTLLELEEAIDASGTDIDYENVSGILTLTFANGSQVIVNRQTPARQLWVAAKNGGHHFDFDEASGAWLRDRDKASLMHVLEEILSTQAGEKVTLTDAD